jgi:hypothetical protein
VQQQAFETGSLAVAKYASVGGLAAAVTAQNAAAAQDELTRVIIEIPRRRKKA